MGGYASFAAAVENYYTFRAETRCMDSPRYSAMPRMGNLSELEA
jgi:hypothetical protein